VGEIGWEGKNKPTIPGSGSKRKRTEKMHPFGEESVVEGEKMGNAKKFGGEKEKILKGEVDSFFYLNGKAEV